MKWHTQTHQNNLIAPKQVYERFKHKYDRYTFGVIADLFRPHAFESRAKKEFTPSRRVAQSRLLFDGTSGSSSHTPPAPPLKLLAYSSFMPFAPKLILCQKTGWPTGEWCIVEYVQR